MNRKIPVLLLAIVTKVLLSGCSIGNRVGQNGEHIQIYAGNINIKDNNSAGVLKVSNGNIDIGSRARVKSVKVSNGNILIGSFSQATSLQTSNGNITTGEDVLISEYIKTTNGNIQIGKNAEIGRSIITTTGSVSIMQDATIGGDVIFEKPGYLLSYFEQRTPTLDISKGVIIKGKIHLYRPVKLLLDSPICPQKLIHHYK